MLNIVKKQGIGTWITLGTVLVSLIALIIYGAALSAGMELTIASGSEVFYMSARTEDAAMMTAVVVCGILSLVFLVAAVVLAQFEFEGVVGKVCDVVVGVLRVVSPALIMAALLYFVYGSLTGLGWTFFSNEELEIYPEAISTGKTVITGLVFFGIASVAGIVASFFGMSKKAQA